MTVADNVPKLNTADLPTYTHMKSLSHLAQEASQTQVSLAESEQ